MANSTKSRLVKKPAKPRPDFPLFPHATGRWAKKVRGKLCYFGPWADPAGALNKWLDQKDDLLAGRTPRIRGEGLTIRDLCNRFLTAKRHLVDTREIAPRTFSEYNATTDRIVGSFGLTRLVTDLAGDDFEKLRTDLSKSRGPVALANEIQRVRSVFKFAVDDGLIDRPVRFGATFKKPSRRVLRLARKARGQRMLESVEIRKLLKKAKPTLKAMILLGCNGGLGNRDVALLPLTALDVVGGWLNYPRPKTGVDRRIPLWKETIESLNSVLKKRKAPKSIDVQGLVFVTKRGASWAKENRGNDPVGLLFRRLLKDCGIVRPGVGFYALRHVFQTIGEGSHDLPAVRSIMGHVDDSISGHYRERIDDGRLRAVVESVRWWLFPAQRKAR